MRLHIPLAVVLGIIAGATCSAKDSAEDEAAIAEVRAGGESLVKAFNAGKAEDIAAQFAQKGELIDDQGVIYQGRAEIAEALTKYFKQFPGAKLTLEIESVRPIGSSLVIEEGTRHISAPGKDGQSLKAQLRFTAVRTKIDGKWLVASIREFADDPPPSPHERLEQLAWLKGDWVNEGGDSVVKVSYRWSDDGNYLLGEFSVVGNEKIPSKSSQRIGWDPQAGKIHSWLFDADGGFSESLWTAVDDDWVLKAASVNPDGQSATATITLSPGKDRFVMKGTDRIVGDTKEPDFEIKIVRAPPTAKK